MSDEYRCKFDAPISQEQVNAILEQIKNLPMVQPSTGVAHFGALELDFKPKFGSRIEWSDISVMLDTTGCYIAFSISDSSEFRRQVESMLAALDCNCIFEEL